MIHIHRATDLIGAAVKFKSLSFENAFVRQIDTSQTFTIADIEVRINPDGTIVPYIVLQELKDRRIAFRDLILVKYDEP